MRTRAILPTLILCALVGSGRAENMFDPTTTTPDNGKKSKIFMDESRYAETIEVKAKAGDLDFTYQIRITWKDDVPNPEYKDWIMVLILKANGPIPAGNFVPKNGTQGESMTQSGTVSIGIDNNSYVTYAQHRFTAEDSKLRDAPAKVLTDLVTVDLTNPTRYKEMAKAKQLGFRLDDRKVVYKFDDKFMASLQQVLKAANALPVATQPATRPATTQVKK